MSYLGDIGGDDAVFTEAGMDVGVGRVYSAEEGVVIEGVDAEGLPWRVWLRTTIYGRPSYRGDFDGNGRDDLLVLLPFIGNGMCIDGGGFLFLMMDERGRPTPWETGTHGFLAEPEGRSPILFDTDGDGRAELATNECESPYVGQERREQRWISAVFEADLPDWQHIEPSSLAPYELALRQRYQDRDFADVLEEPPADEEPSTPATLYDGPELRVTGILPGGRNGGRLRYSDGRVREGWPVVVEDAPEGRQIHFAEPRWALDRLLQGGNLVRLIGADQGPQYLWTTSRLKDPEKEPTPRVVVSVMGSVPIELAEGAPDPPAGPPPALTPAAARLLGVWGGGRADGQLIAPAPKSLDIGSDAIPSVAPPGYRIVRPVPSIRPEPPDRPRGSYFSRGGRCFLLQGTREAPVVYVLPDCSLLGDLQAGAESGLRVLDQGSYDLAVVDPQSRTIRPSAWAAPPNGEVQLAAPPGAPGELIGVASLGEGKVAQWAFGGRTYFVYHDQEGAPLSKPVEAEVAGELFESSRDELIFLRWEDDAPVESIRAQATLEWVRGEE